MRDANEERAAVGDKCFESEGPCVWWLEKGRGQKKIELEEVWGASELPDSAIAFGVLKPSIPSGN